MARAAVLLLALIGRAQAHVGGEVSRAVFTVPPAPSASPAAGGGLVAAPYQFATADTQLTVAWTVEAPTDPTGAFEFHYLDHNLPSQVTWDQARAAATPIPEASGANKYWVRCSCEGDLGVVCPNQPRTHCEKTSFVWDTSGVPVGAYWIVAFNDDPPFRIFTVSGGPVRIAHNGAPLPPAVTILQPDGFFAFSQTTPTLWLAAGAPPLRFDLWFGENRAAAFGAAPTPLATGLTLPANPDGSFGYEWDVSGLANGLYYLRVAVSDASGQTTFSDSYFGVTVHHPPSTDGGPNLSTAPPPPGDEGCSVGVTHGAPALPLVALLALLWRLRRQK